MLLTDVAIRNRTTVAVLGLIIILMGGYSYMALPREAAPDIPIPFINVTTTYEGVSPEDMETSVTMKIETELNGIRGVEEITSSSAEGLSMISVEFAPDVPSEVALQRVRDRVDLAKAELPTDAEEPTLTEINVAEFPVMIINVSGPICPARLKAIADDLEDAIEENVPEVLNVDVLGALEREIRLEMDPDRVASYGLSIPELLKLIPSEHVNISAGGLETEGTKLNVRVPAEVREPEDMDEFIAEDIIGYREDTSFGSIEDLKNVETVSDILYEEVKDLISVNSNVFRITARGMRSGFTGVITAVVLRDSRGFRVVYYHRSL